MPEPSTPDSNPERTSAFEDVLNNEQQTLLEGFVKLAGMMLQARRTNLLLYNAKTKKLYSFHSYQAPSILRRSIHDRNRETRPLSKSRVRLGNSFLPTLEAGLLANPFDQLQANYAYNEGTSLNYPIVLEGQPFAFFKADEREDGQPYSEREQLMLELLVAQLLVSLKVTSATSENKVSTVNEFYTFPNEEFLQAQLPGEIERAHRHNFNLSLMNLNLNLSFANLTPNNAETEIERAYLSDVARILRRNLRSFDLMCQNSDYEFSIVLPHTNEIESYYVAKKLINQFENDLNLSPTLVRATSLAFGISTYPILANNASVLIKQSCQALNQARKTQGHSIYIWGSSRHFDLDKLNKVQDEDVARALLRGFEYISLTANTTTILPYAIPWEISRQYHCLAIQSRSTVLTVAMVDPNDSALIALLARATGHSIVPLVAHFSEIEAALNSIAHKRLIS
jgi:diguanylate cyclase (GGDEF)-like protein